MIAAVATLSPENKLYSEMAAKDSSPSSSSSSASMSGSASGSATSQTAGYTGSSTKVQGCLQGLAGSYTLTADSGTTYTLSGDTSGLKDHVGHEVAITGKTSGSSASSSSSASGASGAPTMSSTGDAGQTLEVQSMKHISPTCKSASR